MPFWLGLDRLSVSNLEFILALDLDLDLAFDPMSLILDYG